MSESPDTLAQQIAALEAALQLSLPEESRRQLLAHLQALQAAAALVGDTVAGDKIGGDKVGGDKIVDPQGTANVSGTAHVAVGLNLGMIIYGSDLTAIQREQLTRYMRRLAAKLQRLPLSGLAAHLDEGSGIPLAKVYVMLATEARVKVTRDETNYYIVGEDPNDDIRRYFIDGDPQKLLKPEYDRDQALPSHAIVAVNLVSGHGHTPNIRFVHLWRSVLVTEAVWEHHRLVLLGDPGGGKSTFLRHLAWALAQRGIDKLSNNTVLFGWDDTARLLPVLLPLRKLAGRIAAAGAEPATVSAALRDEMTREYDARQADELLDLALESGAALLLFDGLDEVPLEAVPGMSVDRQTTLRAVREFAELHDRARVMLTCRTRAFDETLRTYLGWPVETLASFTLGQIRHFVADWYAALIARGSIAHDLGEAQQQTLIAAIVGNDRLRAMAGTPLLLTMMALVLSARGELPLDRPLLYECILEQLLGQWDKVRDGQSLAEAIGRADWDSDRIRPLLDQLSYQAHASAMSEDGRGRLTRSVLRDALCTFFETAQLPMPWESARRCLGYFEQRSGLLAPDSTDSYMFAHLTLQEHCAGRHIALGSDDPVALVMRHRAEVRWREPIFLGAGLLRPVELNALLTDLIHREEASPKTLDRWYGDLILAAEIGADRDWAYLRTRPMVMVDRLQHDLKRGLVALLQDKTQLLPIAERVRAGFLLGDLGDPRIPVTLDDWRYELAKTQTGDTSGYFCRVESGTYIISSPDADPDADDDEKPQHTITFDAPFWIARYPITNAQWHAWVKQAGRPYSADSVVRWDGDPRHADPEVNRPNQPHINVDWHMGNDFCAWFSEQLGVTMRLPDEQEWEAAARGGDARRYPWGDTWQADRAATEEDQETRGQRSTVPVGCYPSGAAPCGVLDMAGNTWALT